MREREKENGRGFLSFFRRFCLSRPTEGGEREGEREIGSTSHLLISSIYSIFYFSTSKPQGSHGQTIS